jgi:hypothetical protein
MSKEIMCKVSGERAEIFREIFGTDEVAIESPIPILANLPGVGERLCYMLDMNEITAEQRLKLIVFLAQRFGADGEVIDRDLDTKGMPIVAEFCFVTVTGAAARLLMD